LEQSPYINRIKVLLTKSGVDFVNVIEEINNGDVLAIVKLGQIKPAPDSFTYKIKQNVVRKPDFIHGKDSQIKKYCIRKCDGNLFQYKVLFGLRFKAVAYYDKFIILRFRGKKKMLVKRGLI